MKGVSDLETCMDYFALHRRIRENLNFAADLSQMTYCWEDSSNLSKNFWANYNGFWVAMAQLFGKENKNSNLHNIYCIMQNNVLNLRHIYYSLPRIYRPSDRPAMGMWTLSYGCCPGCLCHSSIYWAKDYDLVQSFSRQQPAWTSHSIEKKVFLGTWLGLRAYSATSLEIWIQSWFSYQIRKKKLSSWCSLWM